MTGVTSHPSGNEYWKVIIRPNRSLSVREWFVLYMVFVTVLLTIGTGFAALGAWLVLPFAGFEVLVVGLVFWWLARHADDHEIVLINEDRVRVIQCVAGKETQVDFQRYWARVRCEHGEHASKPLRLLIGSHGQFVELGSEIVERKKAALAEELTAILKYQDC